MELLGYFAIVCIGLVLGSIGAGGSMMAIPVFVYLFAMDMETASAYSLFLVGMTSLTGAVLKQSKHTVSIRTAFIFGLPSIAGAFLSRKWIIVNIPDVLWNSSVLILTKDRALLLLFCMLMLTSSTILLRNKKAGNEEIKKPKYFCLAGLGFLVGMIAGLVGAGGGFVIIPALIIFARQTFSTVTATSLLIIASNSLVGFCGDLLNRPINWYFLFAVTALSMTGLLLGYWWNKDSRGKFSMQHAFAWFTMIVGLYMLIRVLFYCFSNLIAFPQVQTTN
jgi:hypothetical protein